ncbi:hypothetical protein QBC38DRAFT_109633 [Podospora fimiseda]|uniref:Fucose-specific lectin n=1 Tax=Podospora fimiseda TaxID=252190 RepID=A0AAN7BTW1_9PEZI|nr:hypothetical protein QBC38DRAFT_109633 [Podospora fimiseda]
MASWSSRRYGTTADTSQQPGLEVVIDHEGLEPAPDRQGQYPERVTSKKPFYLESDRHAPPQSYISASSPSSYSRPTKPTITPLTYSENSKRQEQRGESCRRLWLVLAIIIAILVVVGAIVGGVVGSQEMKKSKPDPSTTSASKSPPETSNTATTTTSGQQQLNLKPNSPLTATGYRDGAFYHIHLFYQSLDGTIHRSRFSSEGNNKGGWSKPENFSSIKLLSSGSSLAATTNLAKSPPEINLYYLNPSSQLSGHRFSGDSLLTPITSLQQTPTVISSQSKLSAYHPVLISQNIPSGTLQYFRDWSFEGRSWENYTLPQSNSAFVSTPLVLLPNAVTYQDSIGVLYVDRKGEVASYLASTNNTRVEEWSWGIGSTGVTFGGNKTNALGGFVNGRTKNLVDTYILFEDEGKLYEARQDESTGSGWKGPNEIKGIEEVEKGTEITCVTMALWELNGVRLKGEKDMNRCFLMGGKGKLMEVWFDGGGWRVVGEVPLQ